MNNFEKDISKYWTDLPEVWTFLWSPEEAQKIPTEHKDQIHFLNEEGTAFIKNYLESSKMTKGVPDFPFKQYFKNIDEFKVTKGCDEK